MERFQQKRSHGRDKYYYQSSSSPSSSSIKVKNQFHDPSSSANLSFNGRAPSGNGQFRKHVDVSELVSDTGSCSSGQSEEDSFAYELTPSSSKQASGTLIKKLLAEELSKEMESRRRPPSVIARLMGLDALPPQQPIQKQHKKFSENYLKKTASIGFVEKNSSHESRSFRMNKKEPQEFKDVYEVFESSHAGKHGNLYVQKETVNSNVSEAKMEFIRQKFMDVKRLSTDEKLQQSKEFHDALDVLDSNKDLLLKFLQEPDSLFTKHLQDLQGVPPPPPAGRITVLKSSNAHKYENADIGWKSERKEWKDVADSCQKSEHGVVCRPHSKHNAHISSKISKPRPERKNEPSLLPTRIVVLKPNVGTLQNTARCLPFPNSSEAVQSGHGKHNRDYRSSENRELYGEIRDQRISSREVELLKHRAHGSRELAKEITRQMRNSKRSSNISAKAVSSRHGGYVGDESSYTVSANDSADESEVKWKSRYTPSTSYSTESSVSREAKKRISERLKMTSGFQKEGTVGRGNTLGEMLAMPDREMRTTNLESTIEGFSDRMASNDGISKWCSPLGISSRDGWKDECARSLPRSRSLPSSSSLFGSPRKIIKDGAFGSERCSIPKEAVNRGSIKSRKADSDHREALFSKSSIRSGSRRSNSFAHTDKENNLIVQESQLKPDEPREIIEEKDLLEETPISVAQSNGDLEVPIPVNDEIALVMPEDAEMSSETTDTPEPSACISSQKYENFSAYDPGGPIPQALPTEEAQEESLHSLSSHCPVTEPESSESSKEAEQPSPVSVLEPQFEDETLPDSDCFESVSADLQGLRMQLQLLKLESSDAYSDDIEMAVSSDEDTAEERSLGFSNEKGELMGRLRNENSRDFSYLVDVLVDSEFLDGEHDMPLATWYSPDCPVGLPVFEKLEKNKYGEQLNWPRSERRLLFDRINAGLMEILQQHEDPHPWIKSVRRMKRGWQKEPLEEEVWEMLVQEEKEGKEENVEKVMVLGKEIRWLDLGHDIDVVGREIERSLMDELVAEVLSL